MSPARFTLFDTAIGRCGVAWSERGVIRVALPETDDDTLRARITERFDDAVEGAPPAAIERAIEGMVALLGAEEADLGGVPLDQEAVPAFHRRVYEVTRAIPRGETRSYGEVAALAGSPGGARAVGQALGRNPFAVIVPCHRVLAANGRSGGFTASGGVCTKLRMLAAERAPAGSWLGYDPEAAVAHLGARDAKLERLMREVGGFTIERDESTSVFASLLRSIVYQQLTGRAAATILARVHALGVEAGELSPARLAAQSDEALRAAGLSGAKLRAIRDLTARSLDGRLPELSALARMDDEAIIAKLSELRGVGRWTVEMFLIFTLGRPDVLPVGDYGVRKGVAALYGLDALPTAKELTERGAAWAPYRSVASWYMWRASERASLSRAPAP